MTHRAGARAAPRHARRAPTDGGADRTEPWWRPTTRFVLSVVVAAVVSWLLWHLVPRQLSISTRIVGYQTLADFNPFRYTYGYYVLALLFPALAIIAYTLLAWGGPLRRSTRPTQRLLPLTVGDAPTAGTDPDWPVPPRPPAGPGSSPAPLGLRTFWVILRVLLPATVVALEVSVGSPSSRQVVAGGVVAGAAYVVAVALLAAVFSVVAGRADDPAPADGAGGPRHLAAVARANSLLAIVVLPLLLVVSHGSTVFIASTQQLVRYPWLPPWVALVATVGCLIAWVRVVGRRHDADRDPDYEAQVLTWLVGPVALFLVMAQLSGPMARFIGYDDAQLLAAPQLVFHHGLFPFRDIYLLHGILGDVLDGAIGMVVFGNTRWGVNSGLGVIVNPLTLLAVYAFAAYFCRKNRLVLVMVVALMSVGFFGVLEPRFVLLPVVLILFDRLLRRPTWGWSLALMFGLVAGSILSPEFVIIAACVLVVLVAFEGARWRRGEPLATTFARTIRCAAVGLVLCVGWALYLGLNHALSPFISFFSDFSTGHNLEGTFPAKWHFATDYRTDFEFFLPTVLWWLTVWRVVAKLRLRRTWLVQDWVMVAAALLALVYFPKALDRADAGHVFESYSVTVPLLALWVFEVLAVADRWLRSALGRARTLGAPTVTHLATALTTVAVLAATFTLPTPLVAAVLHAPARFHPSVPVRASGLLGYSVPGTTDVAAVAALGQLIDRYAGPTAPVFDFADEPGVLYYLLNRVPGTRFFFSNSTQTAGAQQQEISDLERSRPPVAVYNDTSFGIPNFDGVPDSIRSYAVSEYLFTHYRPLVDFEGQLLLLRDDLVRSAPPLPPLPQGSSASALYLAGPACTFGDIPNFFTPPADPAHLPRVTARTRSLGETSGTVGGWAVDPATGRPAAAVVATTASGRMVAFGPTGGSRADVAKDLADPAAATSGFTLVLPGSVRGPVTVYGLTPGGQAYRLDRTARVSPRRVGGGASVHTITVGGRVYRTASVVTAGDTDTAVSARSQAYLVTLPPTVTLSHYPWLRITSATPLGHSTFVLTNDLAAGAGAQITFDALPRSKHSLIMDTDSCLQWHGYSATAPLYLFRSGAPGAAQPLAVTLLGGPPPS